jgi:hypothetical protein
LYGPFKAFAAPLAATRVKMTLAIKAQARRWLGVLRSTTGMRFASALKHTVPVPTVLTNHLYSDAALQGTGRSGIGGYLQGFYWFVLLNGAARDLPISVLEFIAIAVNAIVFEPFVRDSDIVLCTDSPNCVQVLDAGRSKSPLMQHVHVQFMALPEVQSMGAAGLVRHRYGLRGKSHSAFCSPGDYFVVCLSTNVDVTFLIFFSPVGWRHSRLNQWRRFRARRPCDSCKRALELRAAPR